MSSKTVKLFAVVVVVLAAAAGISWQFFSSTGLKRPAKTVAVNGMASFEYWQTAEGTKIYFAQNKQLPMLDLQIQFYAGSADDGDKPGLASMLVYLLDEGTGVLNADDIAEQFDAVGAQYEPFITKDTLGVRLRTLNRPVVLKRMTDLLASILAKPTLPSQSLERIRNITLVRLEKRKQNPSAIAQEAFLKAIYGDHPYAVTALGTQAGVMQIQKADLEMFHQKYINANNMVLTLVGDISKQQANQIASVLIQKMGTGEKNKMVRSVSPLTQSTEVRLTHPSSQSHILFGQPSLAYGDPDYFALKVGNFILGGGPFLSRLFQNIREKEGLAYSAYSQMHPAKQLGSFMAGLQTKSSQSEKAIKILKKTVRDFVETGPTDAELALAKEHLMGSFPLRMNSNRKMLEQLSTIAFFDLSDDFLKQYRRNIEKVTKAQVQAAFERHLDPDKMALVVVGEKTTT